VPTESLKDTAVRKKAMTLQRTIKAVIRPGEQSGYVAECVEIPVATQGRTLDEVTRNLREAVELHLEGEDLAELGLAPSPGILVTFAGDVEAVNLLNHSAGSENPRSF
jgi:predicted RNase H-like HicB family nuclease